MSESLLIQHKTTTCVRRTIKIVLWILTGFVGLIILIVAVLQLPHVQRSIAQEVASSISEKIRSRVEVGSITIAFTRSIVLENILIENRQRDTLLSIRTLAIDMNVLGLFSREIRLNNIRIDSLTAHITRTLPDSTFNFGSILDALSDSTPVDSTPDTSEGPGWKIMLSELSLHGIHGTYNDDVSGLNTHLQVGTLKASLDKLDIEKSQFHVAELSLENTTIGVVQKKETPTEESESADLVLSRANL